MATTALRTLGTLLVACSLIPGSWAGDVHAIEVPKAATASAEDGAAFVKRLGADVVIDSRTADIAAAAHSFAPGGIDAVLALAGGETLERCIDTLRPGGRVAYPNGVNPPKPRSGLSPTAYDAVAGVKEFERLNQAIQQAHLQVPIAAEFALADAAKAQERMEAGHVLGKIILRVRPASPN